MITLNSKCITTDYFEGPVLSDCNDALQPFVIYSTNASTQNRPTTTGYWFIVAIGIPSYYKQIAFGMAASIPNIYARSMNNNVWGAWQKIATAT